MSRLNTKKNKVIALTGGIASGKSDACDFFASNGLNVIKLDEISNALYQDKKIKSDIKKIFNTDKKEEIKSLAFNDKNKLLELENYLQPKILEAMQQQILLSNKKVIVEIPLLFEKKLYDYFDKAIVLLIDRETQTKRLKKRDNIDEELAEKILKNQATNQQRLAIQKYLPSVFVENNTTIKEFEKNLQSITCLL